MKKPFFDTIDFYWRDDDKMKAEVAAILNTLTPEQQIAVKKYGESCFRAGEECGYQYASGSDL